VTNIFKKSAPFVTIFLIFAVLAPSIANAAELPQQPQGEKRGDENKVDEILEGLAGSAPAQLSTNPSDVSGTSCKSISILVGTFILLQSLGNADAAGFSYGWAVLLFVKATLLGVLLGSHDISNILYCLASSIFAVIVTVLFGAIITFGGTLLKLSFAFLDFAIWLNLSITDSIFLARGSSMIRNFANAVLIIGLIVIALGTMVRSQAYGARKLLKKFIVIALLINFAVPIALFAVNATNGLTAAIAGNIRNSDFQTAVGNVFNVDTLTRAVKPTGIEIDLTKKATFWNALTLGISGVADTITGSLFVIIFFGLGIIVFIGTALIFFIRFIALNVLVTLAPLGFALAVLPITQKYSEKWWSNFMKWLFVGPILLLFLSITFSLMNEFGRYNNQLNANRAMIDAAQTTAILIRPADKNVVDAVLSGPTTTGGGTGGTARTVYNYACQYEAAIRDQCLAEGGICNLEAQSYNTCLLNPSVSPWTWCWVSWISPPCSWQIPLGEQNTKYSVLPPEQNWFINTAVATSPTPGDQPSIPPPAGLQPITIAETPFATLAQLLIILGFMVAGMLVAKTMGIALAGTILAFAQNVGTGIAKMAGGRTATAIMAMPAGKDSKGERMNLSQRVGGIVSRVAPKTGAMISGVGGQLSEKRYEAARKRFGAMTAGQRTGLKKSPAYKTLMSDQDKAALAEVQLENGENIGAEGAEALQKAGMLGKAIHGKKLSKTNLEALNQLDGVKTHDQAEIAGQLAENRMLNKTSMSPEKLNKNLEALAHTNKLDRKIIEETQEVDILVTIAKNPRLVGSMSASGQAALAIQLAKMSDAGGNPAIQGLTSDELKPLLQAAPQANRKIELISAAPSLAGNDVLQGKPTRGTAHVDQIDRMDDVRSAMGKVRIASTHAKAFENVGDINVQRATLAINLNALVNEAPQLNTEQAENVGKSIKHVETQMGAAGSATENAFMMASGSNPIEVKKFRDDLARIKSATATAAEQQARNLLNLA